MIDVMGSSTHMVPITEARDHLREIVASLGDSTYMLVRHSRPAAIVLSPDRYNALLERIALLEEEAAVLHARLHPEDADSLDATRARLVKERAT